MSRSFVRREQLGQRSGSVEQGSLSRSFVPAGRSEPVSFATLCAREQRVFSCSLRSIALPGRLRAHDLETGWAVPANGARSEREQEELLELSGEVGAEESASVVHPESPRDDKVRAVDSESLGEDFGRREALQGEVAA